MTKLLFILVLLVIGVAVLGFFRGWFTASRESDNQGGTEIKLKIDRGKFQKDLETFQTKFATQKIEAKDMEAYQNEAEALLKKFAEQIAELKAKASGDMNAKLAKEVEELIQKKEAARRQLAEIKSATVEKWGEIKSRLDAALRDLQEGLDKVMARFP